MISETLLNRGTEGPQSLLNDCLMPVRIGNRIWAYRKGGRSLLEMEEVTGRVVAMGNVKDICSKKGQLGSSLEIKEDPEGGLLLKASFSDKGGVISFPAFYYIDQSSGRVVAFVKPLRNREITLLDLKEGAVVLIPLSSTKSREGGIIITTDKELMKPQNRGRIEGFLKIT